MKENKPVKKYIIFISIIIVFIVAFVLLISPQIQKLRDTNAIRQPLWEEFDKENTEPNFVLTKIASNLVPGDGKMGTNYFFLNRMIPDGNMGECYRTQYKCGDDKWKDFEGNSVILSNKCLIKVKLGAYCNVILPGGTLIVASNDNGKTGMPKEKDLTFQIISTDEQITIKQSVTEQESALWHILAPNFNKKYVVELGDQTVEATGTEFYTSTDADLGAITAVIKGSVKVYDTTISKGQYAQAPYFNILACPPILKACGNSCIPANGICCDTNSYCLSPVQCQENSKGSCKSNLFSGDSSQFCCYNNPNANSFSLFEKGSYDCKDGYKFCANRCIPEDQECCYPTDNDCPVSEENIDIGTGNIPPEHEFPRQYFFNLYNKLIADPTYIALVSDSTFAQGTINFNKVLEYISQYLKPTIEKDYAKSNASEEQTTFCKNNPNSGSCPTIKEVDDSTTSFSGSCSMMEDIKVLSCYKEGVGLMVKNKPGYVQCQFKYVKNKDKYCQSSGNMVCADWGEGAIPKKCLPKGFNDWASQ